MSQKQLPQLEDDLDPALRAAGMLPKQKKAKGLGNPRILQSRSSVAVVVLLEAPQINVAYFSSLSVALGHS